MTNYNEHHDHTVNHNNFDKTFVEGSGEFTQITPNMERTEISPDHQSNPYEQKGHGSSATGSVLPSGNEPIAVGSGKIVSVLGAGGMAKVYKTWNQQLEVFRAVKILLPNQQGDLSSRFETEAKITAKLHHPNIVEIYNVGEWNTLPYIEMELIDGISLDGLIEQNGRLPEVVCCAIALRIAQALDFAHSQQFLLYGKNYQGIVHRDLKPANIMLSYEGRTKLMDFGIARPTEASLHTAEGHIVGTMQYLSPEQLDGVGIDARTDIYSFGTILYEMLTGDKTFPQTTVTALMKSKVAGSYRRFTEFDFPVSKRLTTITQKCLQIEKAKRYESAAALAQDLQKLYRSITNESVENCIKKYIDSPKDTPLQNNKKLTVSLPLLISSGIVVLLIGVLFLFLSSGPDNNEKGPVVREMSQPVPAQKKNRKTGFEKDGPGFEKETDRGRENISPKTTKPTAPSPVPPKTKEVRVKKVTPKKTVKKPNPVVQKKTPIDLLKEKYGNTDLLLLGNKAYEKNQWEDVILALENVTPSQGQKLLHTLYLLEAYIKTNEASKARKLAASQNINDGYYDFLLGTMNTKMGQIQKAVAYFQSAISKPSKAVSPGTIRKDALYELAKLRAFMYQENPDQDTKALALNAWRIVKNMYSNEKSHPRFKEANEAMVTIK